MTIDLKSNLHIYKAHIDVKLRMHAKDAVNMNLTVLYTLLRLTWGQTELFPDQHKQNK